jgi:hypothetical protein
MWPKKDGLVLFKCGLMLVLWLPLVDGARWFLNESNRPFEVREDVFRSDASLKLKSTLSTILLIRFRPFTSDVRPMDERGDGVIRLRFELNDLPNSGAVLVEDIFVFVLKLFFFFRSIKISTIIRIKKT